MIPVEPGSFDVAVSRELISQTISFTAESWCQSHRAGKVPTELYRTAR